MTHTANPAAQAQAALHRTTLLLERCRNGQAPLSAQSLWHQYQQTLFLAWLDAGGFAQEDAPEKENSGAEPLFSAPQRGLNEESKFSRVRINDAVE